MSIWRLSVLATTLLLSLTASAQKIKRVALPPSQNPAGSTLPIAGAVWAGDTLYVSGWLDPEMKTHTDTTSQTVGILQDLQKFLATQKHTMGHVVMRRLFLSSHPDPNHKPDH